MTPAPARVFLCGLPGSGKSTVAPLLAALIGWRAVDLDGVVEAQVGHSVGEIFATAGARSFRAAERTALLAVLGEQRVVVSLGGGALDDPTSRDRVAAAGDTLWLDAPDAVLAARCGREPGRRPLLAGDPAAAILRLRARREPILRAAGARIDTAGLEPDRVAAACLARIGRTAEDRG